MVCFCWVIYVPTQAILSARFPMYAMYASLISLPPLFHLLVSTGVDQFPWWRLR